MESFELSGSFDGEEIPVYIEPARGAHFGKPRGAILHIHGMGDNAVRNGPLFGALAEAGFAVYSLDLRGHGSRRPGVDENGREGNAEHPLPLRFAARRGLDAALSDIGDVYAEVRRRHPRLPHFLVGHSMGTLLARIFAAGNPGSVRGIALSGLVGPLGALQPLARLLMGIGRLFGGVDRPNRLFEMLTFDQYAKAMQERRTELDWLNRDGNAVDAYIDDRTLGGPFSRPFAADVVRATKLAHSRATVSALGAGDGVDERAPSVYIMVGDGDPVAEYGAAARKVGRSLEAAGNRDVTIRVYPGARHELFHEINRDEVFADLTAWLAERT